MAQVQMPPSFFWQSPPVELPVRSAGGVVLDAHGQVVATCPNGSLADVVAYHINVASGVNPAGLP